ncbi:MAG: tetratricopeptide repeat protein [bacterium]|nr:tetratricopeptide repeat protein [bacterium]
MPRIRYLLAGPVWFDGQLAGRLAEEFDTPLLKVQQKISRQWSFVSKYENRGWIIEQGLREYLLEKAACIYGDGLKLFDRSFQVNPNDVVCLTAKGEVLAKMGKFKEAIELFDRAFQINPAVPGDGSRARPSRGKKIV